jgi:hypothetical protein
MILDYKINKKLLPHSDNIKNKLITYLSQFTGSKLTNHKLDLIDKVSKCFIINMASAVKKKQTKFSITLDEGVYSTPAIYNGNNTGRKVSYTYMKILINYITSQDDFNLIKGGVTEWEWDGVVKRVVPKAWESSYIEIPDYWISELDSIVNIIELATESVIEVRDKKGNVVTKRLPERQRELVRLLTKFNYKLVDSEFKIEDNKYSVQVKKIYNNNTFNEGGRIYMSGTGIGEMINRENRVKLEINGEPTVECDYGQLFPRIAADLVGVTLDKSFDPYGINISGYKPSVIRLLAKIGLMCLFNCKDEEGATFALIKEMNKKWLKDQIDGAKSEGTWPDFPIARRVVESLMERNAYIYTYFFSDNALDLMAIESTMMDYIIERVLSDEQIMIPIHDSVIVQEKYKDTAVNIMERAYEVVVGGNNCIIRVKGVEL